MVSNLTNENCWSRAMVLTPAIKTNLAFGVAVDIIPALLGIVGNLVFITTLIKTRSLHTPSNVLVGAMCICDILVGCLANPIFLTYLIKVQIGESYSEYRNARYMHVHIISMCAGLSFLFALLISVDRYFAICHPFRYERSITCKKYILISIATTAVAVILSIITLHPRLHRSYMYETMCAIIQLCSFSTVCFCYARIYHVLYKKRNAVIAVGTITGEETQQTTAIQRRQNTRKTNTICIILGNLFICHAPLFSVSLYAILQGSRICDRFEEIFILYMWITLLVFVNSSMNPVIYFLRSKETRKAAWKIVSSCFKREQ